MTTEAEVIAGLRKELRDARRIISATHKNPVVHTNCEVHNCPICDGGLFQCADCGAAEIETETRVCSVALQAPQEAGVNAFRQIVEQAFRDPIEIWPTGWREKYPALSAPDTGTVHRRINEALSALSQPVATPAPSQDAAVASDETYYTKGKDAEWVEALSDRDLAWALTCAAQDINDSDETISAWMPVTAFLSVASDRIAALAATRPAEAQAVAEGWKPTHRHVKTGGEYMLIGIGKVQAANWFEDGPTTIGPVDLREVAIYRDRDGRHWVRPIEEFDDGRFASLAASPATGGA